MVKFKNIGDFKTVRNVGNVKAPAELKNGYLVTYDRDAGAAGFPERVGRSCLYEVCGVGGTGPVELPFDGNRCGGVQREPVEFVGSTDDYKIAIGEFARIFDTATMKDVVLEINDTILATAYSEVFKGDTLVANAKGEFEKTSDASGYAVTFTVLNKTSYAGNGLEISVNV